MINLNNIETGCNQYIDTPCIDLKFDALNWWSANEFRYSNISKIAKKFLVLMIKKPA